MCKIKKNGSKNDIKNIENRSLISKEKTIESKNVEIKDYKVNPYEDQKVNDIKEFNDQE